MSVKRESFVDKETLPLNPTTRQIENCSNSVNRGQLGSTNHSGNSNNTETNSQIALYSIEQFEM